MLQIRCKNNKKKVEVPLGCNLLDVYRILNLQMPYGPVSAKVNNKVEGLHYRLFNNKDIEFLDVTSASGMRTYTRSLFFLLVKAVEDTFPDCQLRIAAPIARGYYCKLRMDREVTSDDVFLIRERMRQIVEEDIPFHRMQCPTEEAIEIFRQKGMVSKVKLLESVGSLYTHYYKLGNSIDYFYGSLLTHTGGLRVFDLIPYHDGCLLRVPSMKDPNKLEDMVNQQKLLDIFDEHHTWQDIVGISTVGDFNRACIDGHATDLINVSEALQEKKIARIADEINSRKGVRIVLIAGPSSSGKTTFSKRLAIQLMACGLKPYPVSLDDYFVDREKTPLDEHGDYDFESLYALNLELFNKHMKALLAGQEVVLPKYNFQAGKSESSGNVLRLEENTILILEGIHALNPELLPQIEEACKYKIYVSAITTIMLDDHNYIPTTDNRLLRRIVRDFKYRGCSALDTIRRWPSVQAGENKWIFPYQEHADIMFNSALLFELAVIREQAIPLLEQVPENVSEYSEAYRLRKFLRYFVPMPSLQIPPTSLLREFLGGSSFQY
ncbi:nucleoside kinase [Bacteroides eggerthii]|uniref:Nucleoside kinase n=1 Tax=Bacteroides eggerthii TaxID=28111 RepID=A0ABT7U2C0_9BACE|nr:nucleoside kinase [Bacteroides eggerthii]